MDGVKTEDELTSTVGNVMSTSNKEEKSDSSDATPTSSTDANTNPMASRSVSDDPISSTSSDIFEQKAPTMSGRAVDETDKANPPDQVNELLDILDTNEKVTEDVEDLVHDLESLLGEASEPFNLPTKSTEAVDDKPPSNVDKSADNDLGEIVEPNPDPTETEPIENTSGDNKTEGNNQRIVPEASEPGNSSTAHNEDIPKATELSVDEEMNNVTQENESVVLEKEYEEDQSLAEPDNSENTDKDNENNEVTNQLVDEDSTGSWELIEYPELDEKEPLVSSTPDDSSNKNIQHDNSLTIGEDITSSGDKPSTSMEKQDSEDSREADSVHTQVVDETSDVVEESKDFDNITDKVEEHSSEAEAAPLTSEEIENPKEEHTNIEESQNIESPMEISSSEICSKSKTFKKSQSECLKGESSNQEAVDSSDYPNQTRDVERNENNEVEDNQPHEEPGKDDENEPKERADASVEEGSSVESSEIIKATTELIQEVAAAEQLEVNTLQSNQQNEVCEIVKKTDEDMQLSVEEPLPGSSMENMEVESEVDKQQNEASSEYNKDIDLKLDKEQLNNEPTLIASSDNNIVATETPSVENTESVKEETSVSQEVTESTFEVEQELEDLTVAAGVNMDVETPENIGTGPKLSSTVSESHLISQFKDSQPEGSVGHTEIFVMKSESKPASSQESGEINEKPSIFDVEASETAKDNIEINKTEVNVTNTSRVYELTELPPDHLQIAETEKTESTENVAVTDESELENSEINENPSKTDETLEVDMETVETESKEIVCQNLVAADKSEMLKSSERQPDLIQEDVKTLLKSPESPPDCPNSDTYSKPGKADDGVSEVLVENVVIVEDKPMTSKPNSSSENIVVTENSSEHCILLETVPQKEVITSEEAVSDVGTNKSDQEQSKETVKNKNAVETLFAAKSVSPLKSHSENSGLNGKSVAVTDLNVPDKDDKMETVADTSTTNKSESKIIAHNIESVDLDVTESEMNKIQPILDTSKEKTVVEMECNEAEPQIETLKDLGSTHTDTPISVVENSEINEAGTTTIQKVLPESSETKLVPSSSVEIVSSTGQAQHKESPDTIKKIELEPSVTEAQIKDVGLKSNADESIGIPLQSDATSVDNKKDATDTKSDPIELKPGTSEEKNDSIEVEIHNEDVIENKPEKEENEAKAVVEQSEVTKLESCVDNVVVEIATVSEKDVKIVEAVSNKYEEKMDVEEPQSVQIEAKKIKEHSKVAVESDSAIESNVKSPIVICNIQSQNDCSTIKKAEDMEVLELVEVKKKEKGGDTKDVEVVKNIATATAVKVVSEKIVAEDSTCKIEEIAKEEKIQLSKDAPERILPKMSVLEFAPLQLSEDDDSDEEIVPRLVLTPEETVISLPEENDDPSNDQSTQVDDVLEDKPVFIHNLLEPTVDTPENLETILAVASLQNIDIPKHHRNDISEKERKEMEALALAVQSITDTSSSSYVEDYIEPIIHPVMLQANIAPDNSVMDDVQEPLEGNTKETETGRETATEIISSAETKPEETETVEKKEIINEAVPRVVEESVEQVKTKEKEVTQQLTNEAEAVEEQETLKQVPRVDEANSEQTKGDIVQEPSEAIQKVEILQEPLVETSSVEETAPSVCENEVLQVPVIDSGPSKEIVPVLEEQQVGDGTNASEGNATIVNDTKSLETKIEETHKNKSKLKDIENNLELPTHSQTILSTDGSSDIKIEKEIKLKLSDKTKKHKKSDKLEELTINVDVPDREKTYSPKITIKPIKVPDEEVSTTTLMTDSEIKGGLKMTITKQSDNTHSILKISEQENSEVVLESDEPIPKLIIKPKMQQVEQQHSPKMSTRSSKHSPTSSNQRSGSPRITIKPVVKQQEQPLSPLKIKINTKTNSKTPAKEEDTTRKLLFKPVIKPVEEPELVQSPRITIKPIPKPETEKEVNPRLTIKPLKKPEEDVENEDKERCNPKIIIKPIVKPPESEITPSQQEEEEIKERIVLKINKGNLPQSPAKELKKREQTLEEDKSEKLAKITVKFSKEGGHPHIVQQQGEESPPKRPHEDNLTEKNKKQKVDVELVVATRSRHKDHEVIENKSNTGLEIRTKHKDHSNESPVETKRLKKDNLNEKLKSKDVDSSDDVHVIEIKLDSPITISEDSRSQDSGSVILLDDMKEDSMSSIDTIKNPDLSKLSAKANLSGGESATPSSSPRKRGRPKKISLSADLERESATPSPVPKKKGRPRKTISPPREMEMKESFSSLENEAVSEVESAAPSPVPATPSPVPKKKGRPRKVIVEVQDEPKDLKVSNSKVELHESGRPKRSCRGQSVCDTLGIKPRKSRGSGRGRGSLRGIGNRSLTDRDSSSEIKEQEIYKEITEKEGTSVYNTEKNFEVEKNNPDKREVIVIEDDNPGKKQNIENNIETIIIEIDSEDSQLSEKELENPKTNRKEEHSTEPSFVGLNEQLTFSKPSLELVKNTTVEEKEAATKKETKEKIPVKTDVEIKKSLIDVERPIPFSILAPPTTPKDFSQLGTSMTACQSTPLSKPSNPEISSVSSTTRPSEIMIVDEETRMSADTNSRAQTPAKQVVTSSDIVEESQSSVHSNGTTESGKTPSRPSKAPRLEVQESDSTVVTADLLSEYYWNGNGPFMLQEQVAQFLGIKSFKRKYPGIMRRMLDMQERDYIREQGLASEHMCDLGLTAVNAADILDIMYSDFQDKYEEYCKHQRDRQAKEMISKQKALTLAATQEKCKADITEQAVHSAAQWNVRFNKERKEQRKTCMDLQNLTVHYPKGKMVPTVITPHPGDYPVALVPGQFGEFYEEFTPTELNNLPINTICYDPVNFIPREDSDESGSEGSDSESDSSGSSSSSSDSDSSSGIDDCKLCKHSPKKVTPATSPSMVTTSPIVTTTAK